MTSGRSVVLNGDLGSGKTTVSVLLAQRLGLRRISVGDLYRTMAAERGMTALQLNLHAELDDKVDHYVDQLQADIAASGARLVVDSRLAWHFFGNAWKVHMIIDPEVAAQRVLGRPGNAVESYSSVQEARARLERRSESERARFISRYGIDKERLRNYDLICDSTSATPDDIVDRIVAHVPQPQLYAPEPVCYLDPRRIRLVDRRVGGHAGLLEVAYRDRVFFANRGHHQVEAAILAGEPLIQAKLVDEEIIAATAGVL